MAVKILTDSVADIPEKVKRELGISVVPLNVSFGTEEYRDGIDISVERFYEKLESEDVFPHTSAPSPTGFAAACDKLAEDTDEIVVITLSSKLSATYEAARQGIDMMKKRCRVELVDSGGAAMTEGLVVIKAAEAAGSGASADEIIEIVREAVSRVDMLCTFDTLEYLRRGGRIGAAKALLGSVLKINPLLTLRNGVLMPVGRTRSRSKAIDRLHDFAAGYSFIEKLAVEYTACPDEAAKLIKRIGKIFPADRIYSSKMTPVIGAHTGPGLLLVAVLGSK